MNKEERANMLNAKIMKALRRDLGNGITDSVQLTKLGKRLFGKKYKGTFPCDQVGRLTRATPYAIVNLDNSTKGGSHWVAVAKAKKGGGVIVYDSFGRPSKRIFRIAKVFGAGVRVVDTDPDAEQQDKEENCGLRSMSWLYLLDKWGEDVAMLI